MNVKQIVIPALSALFLVSCVSSKKFKKSQADYATLQTQYTQVQGDLGACNTEKADLLRQKTGLETDIANDSSQKMYSQNLLILKF